MVHLPILEERGGGAGKEGRLLSLSLFLHVVRLWSFGEEAAAPATDTPSSSHVRSAMRREEEGGGEGFISGWFAVSLTKRKDGGEKKGL